MPSRNGRGGAVAQASSLMLLVLLAGGCVHVAPLDETNWRSYRARFISGEGRVVDTGQGGISHSEGQGYGLLLAAAHDDRATFDKLWDWTKTHLALREDALLAWKWEPSKDGAGSGRVPDLNNASDGDLLVCWALLRAGRRFHEARYITASRKISAAIRSELIRQTPQGSVLLPGAQGFIRDDGIVVNLSYWVFPALEELYRAEHEPAFRALERSGHKLLSHARFGRWNLPPDWLLVGEELRPAPGFAPRFGYDALRIPLYLAWAGRRRDLLTPFLGYWHAQSAQDPAAWVDLVNDAQGEKALPATAVLRAFSAVGEKIAPTEVIPPLDEEDYYSASLRLLVELAAHERMRR